MSVENSVSYTSFVASPVVRLLVRLVDKNKYFPCEVAPAAHKSRPPFSEINHARVVYHPFLSVTTLSVSQRCYPIDFFPSLHPHRGTFGLASRRETHLDFMHVWFLFDRFARDPCFVTLKNHLYPAISETLIFFTPFPDILPLPEFKSFQLIHPINIQIIHIVRYQ